MTVLGRTISGKKILIFSPIVILGLLLLVVLLRTPSHDRVWEPSQAVLPYATVAGDEVTVHNIRNVQYRSRYDYTPQYYDKTFTLTEVESVDYVVEPFASVAAAHTLVSFGLQDGSYIAISAEARREQGEEFKVHRTPFRSYEFMYVIVDERDALGLRAIHRDNPVIIHPTTATPEQAQALLLAMLERANDLREQPEFYNLFTNSCTTNIADHVSAVTAQPFGWDYRLVLPKESDALAYELGLLDTSTPIETLRQQHDATELIRQHIDSPHFSQLIRGEATTTVITQ